MMHYTRRRFLNYILSGSIMAWLGSILYPVYKYLIPPEKGEAEPDSIKLGQAKGLAPGQSKIFRFGKKPAILIHTTDDRFIALSASCTHLDCIVQYRADMGAIWCACHGGKYDLEGRNIAGPPPKPLTKYTVKLTNGEVIVAKA